MSGLFDKTTQGLGAAINYRLMRNSITSSNIANAETPGYKAKKLDFEAALSRALDTEGLGAMGADHGDHFPVGGKGVGGTRVEVYENPETNTTNDGNTVDLEREMAELSDNTIMYKAALELINKKLGALRYAVTEGAR